jgi:hypothetical protein
MGGVMKIIAAMIAALLAIGATEAFAASPVISIRPGESVMLKLDDKGMTELKRTRAKEMSDYEANLLRRMQMTYIPPGVTAVPAVPVHAGDAPSDPPREIPGVVEITFRHVPGLYRGSSEHSMLTILNGYSMGLRYRATMHVKGRASPTDVCGVLSDRPGVEHWPYSIDSMDLTDFRLESFDEAHSPCE